MRRAEQFKEAILDVLEEGRWTVPTLLETYNANHMTREGSRVYALEHCVFAANFPRWLTNIAGNCPPNPRLFVVALSRFAISPPKPFASKFTFFGTNNSAGTRSPGSAA